MGHIRSLGGINDDFAIWTHRDSFRFYANINLRQNAAADSIDYGDDVVGFVRGVYSGAVWTDDKSLRVLS